MQCKDSARGKILSMVTGEIGSLTSSAEVVVQKPGEGAPPGCAPAVIDDSTIVQLLLAGILDPQKEIEKLQKEKVLQSSSGSVCVFMCVCCVCANVSKLWHCASAHAFELDITFDAFLFPFQCFIGC